MSYHASDRVYDLWITLLFHLFFGTTSFEKVLPTLINPDQTVYIKGRYIGENVRLIYDLIHYTDKQNQKGIAIFLDFKKAFDSVE